MLPRGEKAIATILRPTLILTKYGFHVMFRLQDLMYTKVYFYVAFCKTRQVDIFYCNLRHNSFAIKLHIATAFKILLNILFDFTSLCFYTCIKLGKKCFPYSRNLKIPFSTTLMFSLQNTLLQSFHQIHEVTFKIKFHFPFCLMHLMLKPTVACL